jgi:AraC-like DNA-binding protein/CheY-like chemotaxis protein
MEKVLLVDDEILAMDYLESLIDFPVSGFDICGKALTPSRALRLVEEFKPGIIIMDVKMPEMGGFELSARILATGILCKIIILTAYKDFEFARKGISLGVSDFLVKHELDSETLILALEKARGILERERVVRRQGLCLAVEKIFTCGLCESFYYKTLSLLSPAFFLVAFRMNRGKHENKSSSVDKLHKLFPDPPLVIHAAFRYTGDIFIIFLGVSKKDSSAIHCSMEKLPAHIRELFSLGERDLSPVVVSEMFYFPQDVYREGKRIQAQLDGLPIGGAKILSVSECEGAQVLHFQSWDNIRKSLNKKSVLDNTAFVWEELFVEEKQIYKAQLSIKTLFLSAHTAAPVILRPFCIFSRLNDYFALQAQENRFEFSGSDVSLNFTSADQVLDFWNVKCGAFFVQEKKFLVEEKDYARLVNEYIQHQFNENINAKTIAHALGVSSGYLRRLFRVQYGRTIHRALLDRRLEAAKQMLALGREKINHISACCGFSSPQYFSTVFRAETGFTPQKFIELAKYHEEKES